MNGSYFRYAGRAAGVYVQAARMSLVGGALLSYRTTNQVAQLGWATRRARATPRMGRGAGGYKETPNVTFSG